MLKKFYLTLALFFSPSIAFAVLDDTGDILASIKDIVTDILIPLVFVLAVLFFFWGVAKYIWSDGSGKEDGRKIMIWGIVALFVMTSIWGIVAFIQKDIFGDTSPTEGKIPTIK